MRDFDLRQRKAGAGATRDEERLAKLERELYEEEVDLPFEDSTERFLGSDSPPSGGSERRSAGDGKNKGDSDEDEGDSSEEDDEEEEEEKDQSPEAQHTTTQHQRQKTRSGGSADAEPKRTPVSVVIPERRAAIGQEQGLLDEDQDSLRYAFEYDVPLEMQ